MKASLILIMAYTQHIQDDLLIIESLICLSYDLRVISPQRADRSWQLAEDIAEYNGFDIEEAISKIEYDRPHPR